MWLGTMSTISPISAAAIRRPAGAILFATELGIDARGIDHVISVRRARARRHDRRGIEMTNAERSEVGHQARRIGESEAA